MKVVAKASEFQNMVENVSTFASKDATKPVLTALECRVEGSELRAVATDSYGLCRQTITLAESVGEARVVLLAATDAIMVAKAIKAWKVSAYSDDRLIVLDLGDRDCTVVVGPQTFTLRYVEGTYPAWESLFPTTEPECNVPVGVSTDRLVQLSKLRRPGRVTRGRGHGEALAFTFYGHLKPFAFKVGASIDGIIMPTRLG